MGGESERMIVTETPLRISFAGGGTDLPEYYNVSGIGPPYFQRI